MDAGEDNDGSVEVPPAHATESLATDAAASGSPAILRRPPPGCGAGCRSVTSPGNARARRFYEAGGWSVEGSERVFDLLGVAVPEMRYRRRLATGE